MLRVLDLGERWGAGTSRIFKPWDCEILTPDDVKEADELIEEGVDLALFGGGADVSPLVYRHRNIASYTSLASMVRDDEEELLWDKLQACNVPILGICRGSQFACAKSGGTLVQDMRNHAIGGTHEIVTNDGRTFDITSTHHQCQYPYDTEHELIAWSERRSSSYVWGGEDPLFMSKMEREPEVVYYPKTRALAVQGHPEYLSPNHPVVVYVRELVAKRLLNKELN